MDACPCRRETWNISPRSRTPRLSPVTNVFYPERIMASEIQSVKARQVLDSRGNPTLRWMSRWIPVSSGVPPSHRALDGRERGRRTSATMTRAGTSARASGKGGEQRQRVPGARTARHGRDASGSHRQADEPDRRHAQQRAGWANAILRFAGGRQGRRRRRRFAVYRYIGGMPPARPRARCSMCSNGGVLTPTAPSTSRNS